MAEALINRIADRSNRFGADISEIRVHRTDFKTACDFAQDELRAAQTAAINAVGRHFGRRCVRCAHAGDGHAGCDGIRDGIDGGAHFDAVGDGGRQTAPRLHGSAAARSRRAAAQ